VPAPAEGAPAPEGPFPVGWFLSSLVALAAAIALGEQVLYPLGAGALAILAPRALVVLFFGARLRTFRQVLGFGWGASLVVVAFRFVPAMLDPESPAARVPEGAGAKFWVGGLVFWWSVFSLLYAVGVLAGHLARRRAAR
jgi:hypothetical protein